MNPTRSILMLPWLAHGHVSPFLQLAKKLSLKDFHIYFCSTPINLQPIKENLQLHANNDFRLMIQLIAIQLPSSFQELPPHYHTTKDLPPHLMSTLKTAFDETRSIFCNILNNLKPSLVINDFLQPWAAEAAGEQNIKAVLFLTLGAACNSFLVSTSPGVEFPFQELNFPESEIRKMTQFMYDRANGIKNGERYLECIRRSFSMVLIKTSREIEAKYIDFLSALEGKEMVTVGALVQEPAHEDDENDQHVMKWLSQRNPSSVVYVSFGSEYFVSKEEMEEIAHGLEISNVSFIWVVRFHGGDSNMTINEALPKGFLERVEERGLVVQGWAPQVKILGHSSIGGFASHCGWSSTLEGIVNGVPIVAMPMHLDQPLNARLVKELGVGLEVPRKDGRISGEELARVINEVVAKVEGESIRRRAREFSGKIREMGDAEMDAAADKLLQLLN